MGMTAEELDAADPSTPRAQRTGEPASTRTYSGGADSEGNNEPDDEEFQKIIWGTDVSIAAVMNSFREFLEGFKPKYRRDYNEKVAQEALEAGDIAPVPTPLYDNLTRTQEDTPLYEGYLQQMFETDQECLNLDLLNVLSWPRSKKLYKQCLNYPQEVVPAFDSVLTDMMQTIAEHKMHEVERQHRHGEASKDDVDHARDVFESYHREDKTFRVRPFGGETAINMRDLNPGDTDKLIVVKGLVIRATPVIPEMSSAFFRCCVCQNVTEVTIDRGRIREPRRCPREACKSEASMILIHNRCTFMNKQVIRLQETPDAVPDGQTPHTVSLCVYDELVDLAKPGDRIVVTGIFRSIPVRLNPLQRSIKALFKTYVDCVHVKRTNVGRMGYDASTRDGKVKPSGVGVGGEDDDMEILQGTVPEDAGNDIDMNYSAAEKMEQELVELSHHPDIYDMLARSMAPSIYEMDDVKKGILLQLFGGTNKSIVTGGGGGGPRYRGDINVLMVGDPGTSKSQILQVSDQLQGALRQLTPSTSTRSRRVVCTHRARAHRLSVSRRTSRATRTRSSSCSSLVRSCSRMAACAASTSLTRCPTRRAVCCTKSWSSRRSRSPRQASSLRSTPARRFSPPPTQSGPSTTRSCPFRPTSTSRPRSSRVSTCSTSCSTRLTR